MRFFFGGVNKKTIIIPIRQTRHERSRIYENIENRWWDGEQTFIRQYVVLSSSSRIFYLIFVLFRDDFCQSLINAIIFRVHEKNALNKFKKRCCDRSLCYVL